MRSKEQQRQPLRGVDKKSNRQTLSAVETLRLRDKEPGKGGFFFSMAILLPEFLMLFDEMR